MKNVVGALNRVQETSYKLKDLAIWLGRAFPEITALYLFGSRRYRTRSPRSDIDILVELDPGAHIRPAELRAFSSASCPALDLFTADGGKAVSCENESYVSAASFSELVKKLEAVCFWKRTEGVLDDADIDWIVRIPTDVTFIPTVLKSGSPVAGSWMRSFRSFAEEVESLGLPTRPYLGFTPIEVGRFLLDVFRRAVQDRSRLNVKGKGIELVIRDEYDFQNLFYLTVKPWLPGLGREEITIRYDGQNKIADFNLFSNQLIWELKHIKDASTMAAVAKSLSGLSNFYSNHPNVRLIIFVILVEKDVSLDDAKWEADFSFSEHQPEVWTRIFRNS
jgi:hypothetical protein